MLKILMFLSLLLIARIIRQVAFILTSRLGNGARSLNAWHPVRAILPSIAKGWVCLHLLGVRPVVLIG